MDPSQIGGLSFIGVGALLLLLAFFFFMRTRRFLREAVSTQGMVTGHVVGSGSEGGIVYRPVVQFTAMDGQQVQFQDGLGSNPPRHQVGQMVEVKYPPSNPQKARLGGKLSLWFVPGLLGGMGLVFALAGIPWYMSSAGSSDTSTGPEAVGVGIPTEVASLVPGGVPSSVPSLPTEVGAAGATLTVVDAAGPRPIAATCDGLETRKGGKVVEVHLSFEGKTLTFTVKGFQGARGYPVGQDVKVGGTFFGGGAGVSGAVVFDAGGRSGVVNLVKGQTVVSGSWSCPG